MKKKTILIIAAALGAIIMSSTIFKQAPHKNTHARFIIGILQTASHPSLDAARNGFIDELKNRLGSDVAFVIRNGEGSIANIHTIAQQFHNDRTTNAIFAIATPAGQAVATLEKSKPIFIAAVTDPDALGFTHGTTNVCGTRDMVDVVAQIDMLVTLLPHVKTIGLLYNNGELNSVTSAKLMKAELKKRDINALDFAITNETDLPTAAQMAVIKSDALLVPTDNTVVSNITLLVTLANAHKKPLIVSERMSVTLGALASRGVDYFESGKQTADIAYQVLVENKKPYNVPIEQAKPEKIYINKKTLSILGLTVPESLNNNVMFVE